MAVAEPKSPAIAREELTYEQYLEEFFREPTTMQPYEIIEGVRIELNAPLLVHQRVVLNIADLWRRYERKRRKGFVVVSPFDVVVSRRPQVRTRQPDVLFISKERLKQAGGMQMEGPLGVAPELIAKVLSPSETPRTPCDKIEDFRSIGVQECWIVSPSAETVEVQRLTSEGIETVAVYAYSQSVTSLIVPDLTIKVADIFNY